MTVCCEWYRDRDKVKIRGLKNPILHIGKIKKIKATKNPDLDRRGFFGTEGQSQMFLNQKGLVLPEVGSLDMNNV